MTNELTLTGELRCADEAEAAIVARYLPDHIALTRAEPGCLSFDVERTPDPLIWRVSERFRDRAAFEAHQARVAASDWGRESAAVARDYVISEGGSVQSLKGGLDR